MRATCRLVVEPRSIGFGGPQILSKGTAAVVRTFVSIEHDIDGLPKGLVLQDLTVEDEGCRPRLRGEKARLIP